MTPDSTDMSTPVTRGELREELGNLENSFAHKLGNLENRFDQKLGNLENRFDQKLENLENSFDHKLGIWGGALAARMIDFEQRITAELARHVNSIHEALAKQLSAIDEKYSDLPARVRALEASAAAPGKRPRGHRA